MRIPIGLCATNTEVASLRWVADTFPSLDLLPPRLHRTPRLRPSTHFRRQSRPSQRIGLCATNTEVASLRWVADTFPSLDLLPPRLHRTPRLRPSTHFRRQSRPS